MSRDGEGMVRAAWARHRLKLLAVAILAALAWVAYYLEYLPVSRQFMDGDRELVGIARQKAVQLNGVPHGKIGAFRLVEARRLQVSLPKGVAMTSPEQGPFLAKAARDRATLAGISCGEGHTLVDAHTVVGENATLALSLVEAGGDAEATVVLERADPGKYENGIRVRADKASLRLTAELNQSGSGPAAGAMILCRSGTAATVGLAEFEIPPGQPFVVEILEAPETPGSAGSALFDIQTLDSTLSASSIAIGRVERDGRFVAERIVCGTSMPGRYLWKPVPNVEVTDCAPASLVVTEFDLASGRVHLDDTPAWFGNFRSEDYARFVSRATSNLVVGLLVSAVLAGIVIPWVIGQFKLRRDKKAPARKKAATRRGRSSR